MRGANKDLAAGSTDLSRSGIAVALVGSPNSGKTTLFNALTGSRQKTGNYAGVTVEKREGVVLLENGESIVLLDLPGAYSLDARTPDEAITAEVVRGARANLDVVVAVADLTNLERNLYLVLQLREIGVPMVLALTMSDLARKHGIKVDVEGLEKALGVPIIVTSAIKRQGIKGLVDKVRSLHVSSKGAGKAVALERVVENSSEKIIGRYSEIEKILKTAVARTDAAGKATKAIDKVLLHRVFGPVILFVAFALMFQFIFTFAKAPMDLIQKGVSWLQDLLRGSLPSGAFESFLVNGVIAGVGAVVVFLPQILLLFCFILLFEDSGYMARAAFILDRLMTRVGLQGRAFIPLLSSFACAIPGIMATRTIENRRDRLITILVAPLMTCSARLPIYSLLIGAFVPATPVFGIFTMQGLVMLGMYVFGVVSALTVAFALKYTLLREKQSHFILELPTYKLPSMRNLFLGLWDRGRIFLKRAGTVILGVTVVLWFLAAYPKATPPENVTDEKAIAAYELEHSFMGRAGHVFEPVIRPLGFDWKIGVGLIASFAARETVLSALSTVYALGGESEDRAALAGRLKSEPGFGLPTALSLLVFYALACQCISTIAVVRRETNSLRWPAFLFAYMTSLAFLLSFATYRIALL